MHETSITPDDRAVPTCETMLDHALQLAAEGWLVFPLLPNSKVPLPGSNGFKSATTDHAEIARMWAPDATGKPAAFNIGIRPRPDQVAVDLDVKDGRDGIRNYEALGGRIEGRVIQTPSGGLHVWCTAREPLCTKAGVVGPGIDVRGVDGFCVGPGSTIDGKPYRIISDGALQPVPAFVAEAVGTCADRDARRQAVTVMAVENDQPYNIKLFEEVCRRHPRAVPGIFHDELRNLACEAVRLAISADKAIEVAEALYLPRCEGLYEDGRQDRWVGDMRQSYEWGLGQGDHGANAAGDPREVFGEVKPAADLERLFGLSDIAPPNVDDATQKTSDGSRLRLVSVAECSNAPPRRYTVKSMIAAGDVALVIGPPGAGKSAVTPLIAYSVAQGRPVFNRRTRQGRVFYVAAEDTHGMRGRVDALARRHGACPDFYLVDGASDLLSATGERDDLVALVRRERPAVVVLDTIAAAFPGLKENESEDMGRVVHLARTLATDTDGQPGPAVIMVHHVPKADDSTPRGHGSLNGAADVVLRLTPDVETGMVEVTFGKNRNGASFGEAMAFRIDSEFIGEDEDGDRITAPVAVVLDAAEVVRGDKLTVSERQALGILQDLIDEGGPGVRRGAHGAIDGLQMDGLIGVPDGDWREACDSRGLSKAHTVASRSRKFQRLYKALREKGAVHSVVGMAFIEADNGG